MSIDAAHFTPLASLAGGALIGAAAGLLILGAGRIMGVAGIFAGALDTRGVDGAWRLWLIAGLLIAPSLARILWNASPPVFTTSAPILVVAGLLVGFGARLGSGCTSGHGVCGLARLSPRSLAATIIFMAAGFATVFVTRHVLA
jgi:uncharacterized membrane protein YedE/YeeE